MRTHLEVACGFFFKFFVLTFIYAYLWNFDFRQKYPEIYYLIFDHKIIFINTPPTSNIGVNQSPNFTYKV